MSTVVIDARKWQNLFDLRTGKKTQDERPETALVSEILAAHPYPGDVNELSNKWVSDTALDLIGRYDPQLVCLFYTHQYFTLRHTPMQASERDELIAQVFEEVERFVAESGYTPVMVGTGDMISYDAEIDLNFTDGLGVSSHWSGRYAGLHDASERDLAALRDMPGIERIAAREEWTALFPDAEYDALRVPDYFLVSKPGWIFRSMGGTLRKIQLFPVACSALPVATPLGRPETILDIRPMIEAALPDKKIALIIMEGIGQDYFSRFCSRPFEPCVNQFGWYAYEPSEALFLSIATGTHQVFAYPTGYRAHDENDTNPDYPYSGYLKTVPEHTIGSDFAGRSISVGNRSMLTHRVFGTRIAIECFARNLYNQGCMGVIA